MKEMLKKVGKYLVLINDKYKSLFKTKFKYILQFFPSNFYLLLLFGLLVFVTTPKLLNNKICTYASGEGAIIPNEIVEESIYQDVDISNINKIEEIGVRFNTLYRKKNNYKYDFILYKNDKVIYKETLIEKDLDDWFRKFKINKKVNKGDKVYFELKPINVKKDNGITIFKEEDGNYTYRLYNKSPLYNLSIILSIIFLLIFFGINLLINNNKIKNEEHFYKIMIIYILLVLFIFPPLFAPDSTFHFDRAYAISQNKITDVLKDDSLSKKRAPSNMDCLMYGNVGQVLNEVTNEKGITECFDSKKIVTKKDVILMDSKIGFLFSSLGIRIAMLFTNSPMIIFYFGRLANFLFSFFVILYALKIAPKHKRILLSFVMIPVFIQQMISYSYDSMLNSLSILVIAYLLKFFTDKDKIKIKDLIIYSLCVFVIFRIKLPYVLIGAPIIFVDKEKFGNKKFSKLLYLFFIAIIAGAIYIIPKLGSSLSVIDTSGTGERGMSLASLLDIPNTLKIVFNTIRLNTRFYIETMIGGLGWLYSTYTSVVLIYGYVLFLMFGVASEEQSVKMSKFKKVCIFLMCLMLIGAIFLAMYLAWTTKESKAIEGVQGRYLFAPVLGIILCLIPKTKKINISNETFYSFFNISSVIYLISMLYLFY